MRSRILLAVLLALLPIEANAQLAPTPAPSGLTANTITVTGALNAGSVSVTGLASVGSLSVGTITGCPGFSSGVLSVIGTQCVYTTGAQTISGTINFSSGELDLGNATSNFIKWPVAGVGAPTFTTRSAGTRQVFYSVLDSTHVDFGSGIAANQLYFSLPQNVSGYSLTLYGGTTQVFSIDGTGKVTATNVTNSSLTSGNCMQASTGGIETTVASPCLVLYGASTWHCVYGSFTAAGASSAILFSSYGSAPNFSNVNYVVSGVNDTSNSYNPTLSSKTVSGFTWATTTSSVYSFTACGT